MLFPSFCVISEMRFGPDGLTWTCETAVVLAIFGLHGLHDVILQCATSERIDCVWLLARYGMKFVVPHLAALRGYDWLFVVRGQGALLGSDWLFVMRGTEQSFGYPDRAIFL